MSATNAIARAEEPGRISVARAISREIEAAGVRRIYTVPGESALELFDVVGHTTSVQIVSNRHESGSSFMASAEAKLTGLPTVAIAGRAVGATNLSIGVQTAYADSTPVVVILGQVESDVLGREAFQEIDLVAFYSPIAKWVVQASAPERVPELVAEALHLAQTGRPGPAVVIVPTDFFAAKIPDVQRPVSARPAQEPSAADVVAFAEVVAGAQRPVAIVGAGVQGAREDLVAFAERHHVGVYTAFRRQDAFPNNHPLYLGHLGVNADVEITQTLGEADVILALGTRLSEVTTQGYVHPQKGVRLVHVDVDPTSIGRNAPADLAIVADAKALLAACLAQPVGESPPERDFSDGNARYVEYSTPRPGVATKGVDPTEVMAALREVIPSDAVVTSDAGNYAIFLHRYWQYNAPHSQLAPTNGAMGYGVPAAVAAKLAAPERTVLAVVGDGGFLMSAAELETAARLGAPVVCVVFRNGLYGTIATHQLRMFGRTTGVEIQAADLARYAEGLGCVGFSVTDPAELRSALKQALAVGRPVVIDVQTDPEVLSPHHSQSSLIASRS